MNIEEGGAAAAEEEEEITTIAPFKTNLQLNRTPFFPNCVSILCCTTNGGKTTFLINTLKHLSIYYSGPVKGVIVVLCNPIIEGSCYLELQTETFTVDIVYLDDFEIDILQENKVLIFEDVGVLTQIIIDSCNVLAHHLKLSSVFIVCQSVFSDVKFKQLLSIAHGIVFSFAGANGIRLSNYITRYFCASDELKSYLKTITETAAQLNTFVLLQLNQIARKDQPNFFALVGIENLYKDTLESPPPLYFPLLNKKEEYMEEFDNNQATVPWDPSQYPADAYVLVPRKYVTKRVHSSAAAGAGGEGGATCAKQAKWSNMTDQVEADVKMAPLKPVKKIESTYILNKMLGLKEFTFVNNGAQVQLTGQPKTRVPTFDFLRAAVRQSGPNEQPNQTFALFVKTMKKRGAPMSMIKNKSLLYTQRELKKASLKNKMSRQFGQQ